MEHNPKLRSAPLSGRASAVDLQHLRYAVAAADHGSFRRATEVLLLRQSTLSRCIRQMEERIQMIVFERSSGGVRATEAGRDFLRMARSILEQMDTLVMDAYSAGRGEAGRLEIGFYTSLSAGNLRATLVDYAQRFPQIDLGMVESSRTRLVTALRNIELLQIVRDALLNLRHAPVHLGAREVFVAIVDRLELTAVNGDAGLRQQTHHAAERNEARAHFADGSAIVLAEVGNRLVIWSQTPEVEGTVTSAPLHRQLDGLVHRNIHREHVRCGG